MAFPETESPHASRPSLARRFSGDVIVGSAAWAARAAVLVWAGTRFPPTADGFYYHTIAARIAQGLGSTWQWPDGVVTYAAHYPVGYPALLALAYRVVGGAAALGLAPAVGGWLNALLGTLAAVASYRLALRAAPDRRTRALTAGLAVALHPGLLFYTPALMTEGVTAALVTGAAWMASLRTRRGAVATGFFVGVATLVRPQSLVLAPCLGLLACERGARWGVRVRRAVMASVIALALLAPWTARNCIRMKQCALVSVNGGWNLLIGASEQATGSWAPIEVPEACRTVWDEAGKDACFGREAQLAIRRDPMRWLALVPKRLAATFDYAGAAGFYLHQSNPQAFDEPAKVRLGVVETFYERLAYGGALVAAARAKGPRRKIRMAIAALFALALFVPHAYLAVLGLLLVLALGGVSMWEGPVLGPATFFALASTVLVHAAFFGAGRYSMVAFPLVTALAFMGIARPREREPLPL